MKKIRLALAQIRAETDRVSENMKKIMLYLQKAAQEHADYILFPECSLTGYTMGLSSITAGDTRLSEIRRFCAKNGIGACFGYIEQAEEGLYITQEITQSGKSVFYRKTHLGSKEQSAFLAGSEFPVSRGPVCIGMQLCWESHIPEISTTERASGAELLLVPYASPMSGDKCAQNWSVHLPARASDNGCFVAACNLLFPAKKPDIQQKNENPAKEPDIQQRDENIEETATRLLASAEGQDGQNRGGGMAVYNPKGQRIASYFLQDEHMILCELDGALPREAAAEDMHNISYFDRRRPELFRGYPDTAGEAARRRYREKV